MTRFSFVHSFSFHLTDTLRPRKAETAPIMSNKFNRSELNPTLATGINDSESKAANDVE